MKLIIVWTPKSMHAWKIGTLVAGTVTSLLTLEAVILTNLSTLLCYVVSIPSFALLVAYFWFEHMLPIVVKRHFHADIIAPYGEQDANALE